MQELLFDLRKDLTMQINNVEQKVIKKIQDTSNFEHDAYIQEFD